jgi:hypothetical protein
MLAPKGSSSNAPAINVVGSGTIVMAPASTLDSFAGADMQDPKPIAPAIATRTHPIREFRRFIGAFWSFIMSASLSRYAGPFIANWRIAVCP